MYYKFRSSLHGHSMDVRCIAVSDDLIISGSRDRTAKVWAPSDIPPGFSERLCFRAHANFVSCVCTVPPSDAYPKGVILTGSNDKTICAYTLDSPEAVYTLTGHSGTVCALASGKFGTVVSGSWDQTARVWLGQKCLFTLQGHTSSVWAVAIVNQRGGILTGSADKTIRLWKGGEPQQTFTGHTDCVRDIAVLSDSEFLSASNDGTIRKWLIGGDCTAVFRGHDSFVYSVALMPNGLDFVSSGEDRTVRVWKNGECSQVIILPAQTVWSVAVLPNADIVTATSDGVIRLFSAAPERQGSEEDIKSFEQELSSFTVASGEIGNIKISELPGREALYEPGKKDGQTKMVREEAAGQVSVYQWCAAESQWLKIGDVLGSSTSSGPSGAKVMFEGKEYDYVFDVDIEEGRPPLKLPYNAKEDPWFAAQKFLQDNNLDQMFLDQVANFIIKNSKGMVLENHSEGYADPFTGGSRYIPGGSSAARSGGEGGVDPFTGGGRYVPSYNQNSSKNEQALSCSMYFPQKILLSFATANVEAISKKLKEFHSQGGSSRESISELGLEECLKAVDIRSECSVTVLQVLEQLLNWNKDILYPVLDLLRLLVRHPVVNERLCGRYRCDDFWRFLSALLLDKETPAVNQMLCLRTLCNLMDGSNGQVFALKHRNDIIHDALCLFPSENKNMQIAFATILLNFAVLIRQRNIDDEEGIVQCLSALATLLQMMVDTEAQFRVLVAIGTLVVGDAQTLAIAKSLDIIPTIRNVTAATVLPAPQKITDCAKDLLTLLSK